jgi:hypothetical protein
VPVVQKSFSYAKGKISSFGIIEEVCQPQQKPKEESSPDERLTNGKDQN